MIGSTGTTSLCEVGLGDTAAVGIPVVYKVVLTELLLLHQ